ncbi:MAG: ABC transporter permease [Chlamydiota bacterium]
MFELSVAWKYLAPRRRQLSVSIISILSVAVISMVVWLILVFFSVTRGLEKSWIDKLVTMTAPIRLSPTPTYYDSYYYNIDSYSIASDYNTKSIGEKLAAPQSDPYDPYFDMEIPPRLRSKYNSKDIVKDTFAIINDIEGLKASEYQYAIGHLRLELLRGNIKTILNQACYLSAFDNANDNLSTIITEPASGNPAELVTSDRVLGDGILVAKFFQDSGVQLGDQGFISYYNNSASGWQEQRLPIHVAGFYDPGILPLGGKIIITNPQVVNLVGGQTELIDNTLGNGINVWFDKYPNAPHLKSKILTKLSEHNLDSYWSVKTYQEYDFTKDIVQQLQSEKNLFMLIAVIIMIVACSNIVSMLIILVNDKKKEIGILQSMGATSWSIASIFGFCGIIMGILASLIGTGAALLTLHYLPQLLNFLSSLQGYELLNSTFYGDHIPNALDLGVLRFVISATAIISLLSGIIPAIKACLVRPANILRSSE